MFMKLPLALFSVLFLVSCASGPTKEILTSKEYVPLEINESMYTCPYLDKSEWPEASKLTEVGLVALLSDIDFNNKICHDSMANLKKFLEDYNAKIKAAQPK